MEIERLPGEIWKDIPSFEGEYAISNFARIKSYDRYVTDRIGRTRFFEECLKSTNVNPVNGYIQSTICRHHKVINIYPHILVCELFVGHKPGPEYTVNHKDLDKENCRWDNLEWVTLSENVKHSYREDKTRYRSGGPGYATPIIIEDDEGYIMKFNSVREAIASLDFVSNSIRRNIDTDKLYKGKYRVYRKSTYYNK